MCGLAGDSCCTSIEVPGGAYNRTYTNTDGGPMNEADPATVSGFRLDKYLVTVGRFAQFVTAWDNGSGWTPPAGSGKHTHLNGGNGLADSGNPGSYEPGWQTSDDVNIAPTSTNLDCSPGYSTWGNAANLPITCVNWYEAYAFCIWDGGFLPSEAEWEFAAAGGSEELEYPWGTTDPDTSCMGPGCEYAIYGCYYPGGSGNCSGVSNIAPVGTATLGIGRWNQLDLAGDAWEWNLDYYAPYVDPCTDCAYLATAPNRVVRGGVFNGAESYLLPPGRGFVGPPTSRDGGVGFRCARTP
jgi:formylglycine-generating enzyme required for sulfatase activity